MLIYETEKKRSAITRYKREYVVDRRIDVKLQIRLEKKAMRKR